MAQKGMRGDGLQEQVGPFDGAHKGRGPHLRSHMLKIVTYEEMQKEINSHQI